MPPDIRSFFVGKSSQDSNASAAKAPVKKEVCIRFYLCFCRWIVFY